MFNRAAFGVNNIFEWYNRRMDKVVAGLEGVRNIVDDILINAPSLSILKKRTRAFCDHCRQHGVTLKKTKLQLAVTEVEFGGFRLSKTGIQTSPDLLKGLCHMWRMRATVQDRLKGLESVRQTISIIVGKIVYCFHRAISTPSL